MLRHALVLALLLAPLALARADDAEDKAAALVEKLGGRVQRDDKAADNPVIVVLLDDRDVTDATLKELKALRNLQTLRIAATKVTDAVIMELKEFKNLQVLVVENNKVTDAAFKELKALKNLKELWIAYN